MAKHVVCLVSRVTGSFVGERERTRTRQAAAPEFSGYFSLHFFLLLLFVFVGVIFFSSRLVLFPLPLLLKIPLLLCRAWKNKRK